MTIRCFWLEPTGEELREACGGQNCGGYCERKGYCSTYHPLRRVDTGEVFKSFSDAPPGAMVDCTWHHDAARPEAEVLTKVREAGGVHKVFGLRKHPDGRVIMVKTPGGDWLIDQISSQGSFWTRTGEPPNITASPSIICGSYHGWLRNGELIEV